MHITVASTAEGCEGWLLELDVQDGTTVAELKRVLACPPHRLDVKRDTKVLGRINGQLATLFDKEKVPSNVTLLGVNSDRCLRFPEGFLWGAATAAFQVEGAAREGGRTPSIWDTFCAEGRAANGDTAVVACDHYHRFRDDVKLMKELGLQAYRFSISWPRLMPQGRGEINQHAVEFYGELLDELHAHGIVPMVTIYHWDLPQCLEDEYGGWLSRKVVADFEEFAAACFSAFGDRVKWWLTFNEPWCMAALGYASNEHAPGKSKKPAEEPYVVTHHIILAHARAVRRYRAEFQESQQGSIGIALNMDWKEPLGESKADADAQRRAIDWQLSWFMDPICRGHYPATMRKNCEERLPSFTDEEAEEVRGTLDFLGLNHYSTDYVSAKEEQDSKPGYFADMDVNNVPDPLWPKTDMGWDIVPWGLNRLLAWVQREYAPPQGIFITENGCACKEDSLSEAIQDTARIEYLQGYLAQVYKAIDEAGVQVRGYMVWSFMDNFEWAFGYAKRFGIVRVDYDSQKRTPKASAALMSGLASTNVLKVSERVLDASEHSPFNTRILNRRKPAEAPDKKPSKPKLSTEQTMSMLREFVEKYQHPKFQAKMVDAFRQYMMTNDDVALMKARQLICLPIQMDIIPKYGFEATRRGVAQATSVMQSLKEQEANDLNASIVYLTKDMPHAAALEGAVG